MSRPIDGYALLEKLNDINVTSLSALIGEQRTVAFYVYCKVVQAIEKMPTINAVEVVRCKDCKYGHVTKVFGEMCQYCGLTGYFNTEDGYCDKGEMLSNAEID